MAILHLYWQAQCKYCTYNILNKMLVGKKPMFVSLQIFKVETPSVTL